MPHLETRLPPGDEQPAICRTPAVPPTRVEKEIVLFIAILSGFITPFDSSAVNIALPTIGGEFHVDAIMLSWISTVYLLSTAVFLVPFGKLADIYGRKKIYLYGIVTFVAASFLMTTTGSVWAIIGFRILQGIGCAMIFGTAIAILTTVLPKEERGRGLGIYITAVYLGLSLGPFLGGILTGTFGWRSIFWVNVPVGAFAILLILWKLRGDWAECEGEKFDLRGSLLYGCAIVAVMLGLAGLPATPGFILIAAGLLLAAGFVRYELRTPSPVLDMSLFSKSRAFTFSNLAALINYSATYAVTFLLSLYLQYIHALTPEAAGAVLVAQPLVMAVISPFAGKLSDRVEPRIIASAGMALCACGLVLLAFLSASTPIWYFVLALVLLGIGFGLFTSPNTNAIMSAVPRRYYGVASGTVSTMRLLGQMLSMGFAMMLFAVMIGRVEITPEYFPQFIGSVQTAFALFAVLCVIGILASLVRGTMREAEMPAR